MRRLVRFAAALGKGIVYLAALVLMLAGALLLAIETGWAKNRIRDLIVRQANEYLTATLDIGGLQGSLLRGLTLDHIRLSRDNVPIIAVDQVSLSYSLRELWQHGTIIRRIRLVHPVFALAKQRDGRWNISALVKREARQERNAGPGRPLSLQSIEIVDGRVSLADPLTFGAAHVPTRFDGLNASFSFAYRPVTWTLAFTSVSWKGAAPSLDMLKLSGGISNGPRGWRFDRLSVQTPRSAFTVDGLVERDVEPTALDLTVHAARFAFQEWGGILHGLDRIAVDARFDTRLDGPVNRLATDIALAGTGGSVKGRVTLDTSVEGWHGAGAVDVGRLDLARWLNRPDRPSDITGRVAFNLDLELGHHFPRGTYAFDGPHASFMDYGADAVHARGELTATDARIAEATATAYGAGATLVAGSTIGLDEPFPFRFKGTITRIDLRTLPKPVPVPHVESLLTFDYDVSGRFSDAYIAGSAAFADSRFLGARLGAGATGTIDTSAAPIRYGGEGDLSDLDVNHLGAGLEVGWMQDPRYRGTIAGHFTVDGQGSDRATLVLHGGGRIAHAALALGTIDGADVRLDLDRGAMHTAFDGRFDRVDPAVAFGAAQVEGQVTGRADVRTSVRDIYADTIGLGDYDVDGTIDLQRSVLRRVRLDSAHVEGSLHDAVGRFPKLAVAGPVLTGQGSGTIAFDERHDSAFDYDIANADLAQIEPLAGRLSGRLAATGHVSGPFRALTVTGRATIGQLAAPTVSALEASGKYTLTVPSAALDRTTGRIDASASFLTVAGDSVQHAQATVTRGGDDLDFTLALQSEQGRHATAAGAVTLATADQRVAVHRLSIAFGRSPWTLAAAGAAPVVRWSRDGVSLDTMTFVSGAAANERIAVGGDWRRDGSGALHVALSRVYLDTLQGAFERPARYGGIVDAEATIRGTAADPSVSATFSVTDGRVRRVSYEKISGRVDYTSKQFTIDARLDQAPGVWLTAKGTVPRALFDRSLPEQPIDLSVVSSAINLGLLDGLTDVVSRSRGTIRFDVRAIGTSRDPHFQGFIEGDNVGFLVAATGSTYKNGHAAFRFTRERVDVDAFHIEDANGRPLDLHGSLATHELSVGNLEIDASCRNFEVIHNEFGRVQVAADLQLRGRLEAPRIAGDLTISSGDVRVDQILERAVFQPYHTEEAAAPVPEVDAVAALNPWDRLGLDISLHTPNTLKLSGENVQVSPGAPIGLGNIKLRAAGDLYLYKDPGSPLSVNGSLDSVSGTYGFQGRDFDVDPSSSITFTGDLDPELYVVVTRLILGVDTRVTISGPLRQPELRLSSNPPLDSSDILSLIVFNTSPNQLSATQQQELAVRAGALAAGFIATPVINALQNELGLDVLSVEPSGDLISTGPKVTVGEELAPGLVARFSRQFGSEPYDEATIEYYLSRILRLRATFSDAQSLEERSPFRRIERAGVDLLFFFSF